MEDVQNVGVAEVPAVEVQAAVPQDKVNELVGLAKQKGHEKGYQQAMQELQAKQSNQSVNGVVVNADEVSKMVSAQLTEHLQKQNQAQADAARQHEINRISGELKAKMHDATSKMSDFNEKTNTVNFSAFPNAVLLSNTVDGDIWPHFMVELAENPEKLDRIESLAQRDPGAALVAVNKLKQSIKSNLDAQQAPQPKEPSNSLKSSNVGVGKTLESPKDFQDFFKGKF